jgi:hypothetical protein
MVARESTQLELVVPRNSAEANDKRQTRARVDTRLPGKGQGEIMKRNCLLLLGILLSVTCLFAKVVVDYDHSVSFSKFHTYSWVGVTVQEALWNDRVMKAVDTQLAAKGWTKVASGGDASVSAVGSTRIMQTFETWYGGGFGGGWYHRGWWGGGGPGYVTVERTPVGTLHIDIFDSQSKKVIWHGDCSDTLTGNPEKNEKKLEKAVGDVFKKFPPPDKG